MQNADNTYGNEKTAKAVFGQLENSHFSWLSWPVVRQLATSYWMRSAQLSYYRAAIGNVSGGGAFCRSACGPGALRSDIRLKAGFGRERTGRFREEMAESGHSG